MEQNRKDLGDIGRRRKQNMEVMPVILSCRRRNLWEHHGPESWISILRQKAAPQKQTI
jgi:hypothetical protein